MNKDQDPTFPKQASRGGKMGQSERLGNRSQWVMFGSNGLSLTQNICYL